MRSLRSTLSRLLFAAVLAVTLSVVLVPQKAEAGAMSNYLQNKFVDALLRGQSYTFPTTVYVGLATGTSTAASCGSEVSGGSYARVSIPSSLANWAGTQGAGTTVVSSGTSGQTSNNAIITFPAPTASWGVVTGFCIFDASSGGNLLIYAALTTNKTVNGGDSAPSFGIAALTYTISQLYDLPGFDALAANEDKFRRAA